jgi:hypothetical protein
MNNKWLEVIFYIVRSMLNICKISNLIHIEPRKLVYIFVIISLFFRSKSVLLVVFTKKHNFFIYSLSSTYDHPNCLEKNMCI